MVVGVHGMSGLPRCERSLHWWHFPGSVGPMMILVEETTLTQLGSPLVRLQDVVAVMHRVRKVPR